MIPRIRMARKRLSIARERAAAAERAFFSGLRRRSFKNFNSEASYDRMLRRYVQARIAARRKEAIV